MSKREVLKQFLGLNEVLVVDKNPSSRNRLLKTMYDLGAKRAMIHTCGTLEEARKIIETKKIGIVLSDYYIGGGSGFDLFKMLREQKPESRELCLILVTSNISQTAVAKAAEEDVDSFIIKPYTIQSIQENLISTVASKIAPSEYILQIEKGKTLMKEGKYEEAIEILVAACSLHPKPSLALFYIGQAEYLKNHVNEAATSYNKGLSYNNIHYKCLVGLYEVFMREKMYSEAYQVVKKIAKYFPANPDRFSQIIRLAVRTENFKDMLMYYDIYTQLEERFEELTKYIGAGMYVAGKYCLLNNDRSAAMEYFERIAVSCSGFTKFLRAVITVLVQYNCTDEAESFLSRFDPAKRNDEDYLVSDFLVNSKKFNDHGFIIKNGLELWNKKIRDYSFLEALIGALKQGGYHDEKIAPFKEELYSLYPDKVAASSV